MTPLVLSLAIAQVVGVAADLRGTLQLSDYSQASLRPAIVRPGSAIDLESTPSATLRLQWARSNISLGYGPRFTLRDVREDREPLTLHSGYASYRLAQPRYVLTLTEAVSYGEQSLIQMSFLAPPQATPTPQSSPPINQLGRVQTVRISSEITSARLDYAWARRWSSGFEASYGVTGGIEAQDQRVLPRAKSVFGRASLDHAYRRNDILSTAVGVGHSVLSNGFDNWMATVTETWNHRLNRDLRSSVGAGLGWFTSRDARGARTSALVPVASLGIDGDWVLQRRRAYSVTLQGSSSLAPVLNPYVGSVQQRAQVASTLRISTRESALSLTVSGSQTIPWSDENAFGVIGFGVLGTHRPAKFLELSAGYRTAWQNSNQPISIPQLWMAFVGVALYAPPLRF